MSRRLFRLAAGCVLTLAAAGVLAGPLPAPAAHAATSCPAPQPGIVRSAPGAGLTVALTFDDGPGAFTPQILAILRQYDVRATFFDTGAHDAAYPAYTTEIAAEGHLVADHTYEHEYPSAANGNWSYSYLAGQFDATNSRQRALTGRPTCFFRPPGGFLTPGLTAAAASRGMSTVLWSVDTEDWKQPSYTSSAAVSQIVSNAAAGLNQAHPIVLLHTAKASHEPESQVSSNRSNDLLALPQIIRMYAARGYRFVDLFGNSGLPTARATTLTVDTTIGRVPAGALSRVLNAKLMSVTGPVAGASVRVSSRLHGARTWTYRATVRTAADGTAAFSDAPTLPTEYTASFAGNVTYASAVGSVRTVVPFVLPTAVAVTASAVRAPVGAAVTVTAVVTTGGMPRVDVPLTVTTAPASGAESSRVLRTDSSGRVSVTDTASVTVRYTVTVDPSPGVLAGAGTVTVVRRPAGWDRSDTPRRTGRKEPPLHHGNSAFLDPRPTA